MFEKFDPTDADSSDRMRDFFSPAMVDQEIRQAIHICWMMFPKENRSVEAVEQQIRRIVDRALRDLREDDAAFGIHAK